MNENTGDRAHPATPIRLEQARRDGDIPRSFELASAVQMLGGLIALLVLLGGVAAAVKTWTRTTWSNASSTSLDPEVITSQLQSSLFSLVTMVTPLLLLILMLSLFSHWCQIGWLFRPQKAAPELGRLSASKWFENTFSFKSLMIPVFGLPKALLAFGMAGFGIWLNRSTIFGLGGLPVEEFVSTLFTLVLTVALQVAAMMLVLSGADYALARWRHERRMRMSDQQLRDELRMQNGDPAINSRRREVHRTYGRSV